MSIFGGLALGGLGSALDFGFDTLGGILGNAVSKDTAKSLLKRQFAYQKELMQIQNDYNVYNYQHQHQWRTQDLRDAGLNPILSASSNSAVAPVGNVGVGLPSAGFPSGNSARMSGLVRQLVELNSARAQSEIRANDASAARSLAEAKATTSMTAQNAMKFKIMEPAMRKQAEYESSTSHQWSRYVNDWTQALSPVFDMVPGTVLMRGVGNFLKRGSSSARGLNRDLKSTGYYDLEPSASKGHRWLHVDGDGGFRDSNDDGFTPRYRK